MALDIIKIILWFVGLWFFCAGFTFFVSWLRYKWDMRKTYDLWDDSDKWGV